MRNEQLEKQLSMKELTEQTLMNNSMIVSQLREMIPEQPSEN